MISRHATLLRCLLTLLLVSAIHLAGIGRAFAAASFESEAIPVIAGVAVHICHAGGSGEPDRGRSAQHDCCDACALCAPALLPGGPDLTAPAAVVHVMDHAQAVAWAPVLSRPRTPRLAQGPPSA